ncbi:hypothetical protein MKZ38_006429 [Zalerion maritima]|uniref:Helicase ATP-binding domain-containing protein n=1 Tax=Zalerion maritima TaxID=339359 RepID=A0AAD5WWT2_9PEZI|nr:hypothetical protein MKZ38_006429 [Zalerion maritima]
MDNYTGLLHKTTIQSAREKGRMSFKTNAVAGQKRPFNDERITSTTARTTNNSHFSRPHTREKPRIKPGLVVDVEQSIPSGPSEYTQREEISATPRASVDPYLSLSHLRYGIPQELVRNLEDMGINQIYPWQKQCLLGPGLLSGEKNLVYSAPTGGGKSLIADIMMLKKVVMDPSAKALLVLPFVALVQEKVRWLRNIVRGIHREPPPTSSRYENDKNPWRQRADRDAVRIVGFFGGSKVRATWHDFDIGVCTIEKANGLVNTAIDDCSISSLQTVVLDELHMVDDEFRGYILELLATKILSLEHRVQIIGMSATLSNMDILATWLDAHSYETHYRPVPIREHLVYDAKVYPADTSAALFSVGFTSKNNGAQLAAAPVREIQNSQNKELQESILNSVVALACETAWAGYGALVFTNSRVGCEADALLISRAMPTWDSLDSETIERRLDVLSDLRSLSTGLDTVLEQTIPYGVAFHHVRLSHHEYKYPTSSPVPPAPARRVILHGARMGRDLVGPSMLRQMRGRAGRKGKDEIGETYLCCKPQDLEHVVDLMQGELPQITSGLAPKSKSLHRAILEIVAIRLATSLESISDYMDKTLLRHSSEHNMSREEINSTIDYLTSSGYVSQGPFQTYQPTKLGKAVVASGLDPEDGLFVHREFKRALRAFVMDGELHILYAFTPVNEPAAQVNWQVFRNEMEELDDSGLRVLSFLGIRPTIINKLAQGGTLKESTPEEKDQSRVYKRFYLALQLRDLCNELPVYQVANKYDMPRGVVQSLAQTCQGFAASMIKFCDIMDWGVMSAALDHFTDRLRAGARSDLLALAKITFVKSRTARVFWDNGFKTVAIIANAGPDELVPVLMQAQPSKLRLKDHDEEKYKEKLLAKAKVIADSASRLWQMQIQEELDAYAAE